MLDWNPTPSIPDIFEEKAASYARFKVGLCFMLSHNRLGATNALSSWLSL